MPTIPEPLSFEVRHRDKNGELQVVTFEAHAVVIAATRIKEGECEDCHEEHRQEEHYVFGMCPTSYYLTATALLERRFHDLATDVSTLTFQDAEALLRAIFKNTKHDGL